ncbi:ROK family protein [Alkalicoccus luteus]|uniref:ROK family transcriptional regulator n=1 Tax=Alkalicoccus luteus TaxID=1237094 RepID=A0A969PUT1_9BACI|nr:ROK family protein [Alkalicoccus luteus]NJP36077.1 ROK family transcriptional regulator [Alkalicoccus luteus]
MITGDAAYIKQLNRGLLLREISDQKKISRAALSKVTGLNKATISAQVAQLLEEELIYETEAEHYAVGRRPIMLSINEKAGYVLGADLDKGAILYHVSDLAGNTVLNEKKIIETEDYEAVLGILAADIEMYTSRFAEATYGLIRATIGIHGTVSNDEEILFVPKLGWRRKSIKSDLQTRVSIPLTFENNANLSAYAERVFSHQQSDHLMTVILSSGIGSGMIIHGELEKGHHGYAGEMGHMIIYPEGRPCKCGNSGCWERYASESSFFDHLAEELGESRLTAPDVQQLLEDGNSTAQKHMDSFIRNVSIGLNNVINLYNPETLVLNSDVLSWCPRAIERIKDNLVSNVSTCEEICLSRLGGNSCVLGACALSIQTFLNISHLTLSN